MLGRIHQSGMKLIPIDASGSPAEPVEALPETAREVCMGTASLYGAVGFEPPWIGYLAKVGGELVGTCAFKAPARANRVEIAYFTFPSYEGRGFATRMVGQLLELAAQAMPGVLVVAQTLPTENASTSVLKRNGFVLAKSIEHPEDGLVWEWQRNAAQPRAATDAPQAARR